MTGAPLRILLASFAPDDENTGMGRWARRIASQLAALGHRPTIWSREQFPSVARMERWSVVAFPIALAARVLARRAEFDVVVVHEPAGFWCTRLRRLVHGFPAVIAVCHNVESKVSAVLRDANRRGLAQPTRWGWLTGPLLRRWQSDGTIRRADAVVCLSEEDRRYLAERGIRQGAAVRVIPNGAEPFQGQPGGGPGAPSVLVVGGWLDVKGRRLTPALWSALRALHPEARLTLAGTGWPVADVLPDFEARDRDGVRVLPRVTGTAAMAALYAEHGVLLLPSLSEGSPLTLLEAMDAGLPVVAAAVGGIPDVVRDGRDGLLFRAGDAADGARQLARVLSDSKLAADVAFSARERVRAFTWSRAAGALADLAAEVAAVRSKPGS